MVLKFWIVNFISGSSANWLITSCLLYCLPDDPISQKLSAHSFVCLIKIHCTNRYLKLLLSFKPIPYYWAIFYKDIAFKTKWNIKTA